MPTAARDGVPADHARDHRARAAADPAGLRRRRVPAAPVPAPRRRRGLGGRRPGARRDGAPLSRSISPPSRRSTPTAAEPVGGPSSTGGTLVRMTDGAASRRRAAGGCCTSSTVSTARRAEDEPGRREAGPRRDRRRSRRGSAPGADVRRARPQGRPRDPGPRPRPRPAPGAPARAVTAPLAPTWSYLSLTEASEYALTEDDERERLAAEEGITDPPRSRRASRSGGAHGALPRAARPPAAADASKAICFYPMSKRRAGNDNWYALDFDARKELMNGHARVGRTYAGASCS